MQDKRKRVVLSIHNKLEILQKLDAGESLKNVALQYGVGEQTVRDMRRKKDELISFAASFGSSSGIKRRKTMKKSTYEELDNAMLDWFTKQRALGVHLTGLICSRQARYFFKKLGLEGDFDASTGWLTRFKQRHGIREISSRTQTGDSEFRREFPGFVLAENLVPEQIYSADETALYWKCLPSVPSASLASESTEKPEEAAEERLTLMCCSNAAGGHKLPLVVVGETKRLQTSRGTPAKNLPADYYQQKGSSMDEIIFTTWFCNKFVPQVQTYLLSKNLPQKAVLLLEKTPSHPGVDLQSEDGNIFVKYLPENVPSLMESSDKGVISTMKRNYRAGLLQKRIQEGYDFHSFWKDYNFLDALYDISSVWDTVPPGVFLDAWKKVLPDLCSKGDFMNLQKKEEPSLGAESSGKSSEMASSIGKSSDASFMIRINERVINLREQESFSKTATRKEPYMSEVDETTKKICPAVRMEENFSEGPTRENIPESGTSEKVNTPNFQLEVITIKEEIPGINSLERANLNMPEFQAETITIKEEVPETESDLSGTVDLEMPEFQMEVLTVKTEVPSNFCEQENFLAEIVGQRVANTGVSKNLDASIQEELSIQQTKVTNNIPEGRILQNTHFKKDYIDSNEQKSDLLNEPGEISKPTIPQNKREKKDLTASTDDLSLAHLSEISRAVPGGEKIDEATINEWLECDNNVHGFLSFTNEEIVTGIKVTKTTNDEEESESDEEKNRAENGAGGKITHNMALQHIEALLDYLEEQEDSLLQEKIMLRKFRSSIRKIQFTERCKFIINK